MFYCEVIHGDINTDDKFPEWREWSIGRWFKSKQWKIGKLNGSESLDQTNQIPQQKLNLQSYKNMR